MTIATPAPIIADDDRRQPQLSRLEIASLLEATTLAALVCVAVPLKHLLGVPLAVTVMGPVHGLAFIFYIWAVIQTVSAADWRGRDIVRLIAVAFVPFAGFLNLSWLRRQQRDRGAF